MGVLPAAARSVAVLYNSHEYYTTNKIAQRSPYLKVQVIAYGDGFAVDKPGKHLNRANNAVMQTADADEEGNENDDKYATDGFLSRRHHPRHQPHEPAGAYTAAENDLPIVIDHFVRQIGKRFFTDGMHHRGEASQ